MQSVLDGLTLSAAHKAGGYDPAVIEGDHGIAEEVCVAAGWVLVEMHVTNCTNTQRENTMLNTVLD